MQTTSVPSSTSPTDLEYGARLSSQTQQPPVLAATKTRSLEYPAGATIPQIFQAQVERCPGAVAVVFGDEQLTYRELNERANRLADQLQAHGVRPEVLVGICVRRSTELIVGLLGILKAGGAYVPLDPAYPQERLSRRRFLAAPDR